MAKIYLKGRFDPVEVDGDLAKQAQADWKDDPNSNELTIIGGLSARHKDIKFFLIGDEQLPFVDEGYNLDDPSQREIIKEFEKDFVGWLAMSPKWADNVWRHERYFEELGAQRLTWLTKNKRYDPEQRKVVEVEPFLMPDASSVVVLDGKLFDELHRKWNALTDLRGRRKYASEMEADNLEKLEEHKQGLFEMPEE